MPSITVKSISFDDTSFRKLANITIEFAPRITVIAGHNGIGKSTILALLGTFELNPSVKTTKTMRSGVADGCCCLQRLKKCLQILTFLDSELKRVVGLQASVIHLAVDGIVQCGDTAVVHVGRGGGHAAQ